MGAAYSLDLRERVVASVEVDGLSRNQAAARFGVAISTAVLWVRRFRQTGSVAPSQIGGYKPRKISGAHRDWLIGRCRHQLAKFKVPREIVFVDALPRNPSGKVLKRELRERA